MSTMTTAYDAGRFIVIEGLDGTGKSSLVKNLNASLSDRGIIITTVVDGESTELSSQLRQLSKQRTEPLCPEAAFLIFAAASAQTVSQIVIPALIRGEWVVMDRFVLTSAAYSYTVREAFKIAKYAAKGLQPDITLYLQAPLETCVERISLRDRLQPQLIESPQVLQQRLDNYSGLINEYPNLYKLDASGSEQNTLTQALQVIDQIDMD